jgi:hypothetical protein
MLELEFNLSSMLDINNHAIPNRLRLAWERDIGLPPWETIFFASA